MRPKLLPIASFIEFGDADAIAVGRHVLCHDVHCDLGEVGIRSDSGCRRDARLAQDRAYHAECERMRRCMVHEEVVCHVDEYLVDGVDVDVLGCDVAQVDRINARAVVDVERHARHGDDIACGEAGILGEFRLVRGFPDEPAVRRTKCPSAIDLAYALDDFKEARASGHAAFLECGRYGKADRLFRAAFVGDDEIRAERVEPALVALDRGVK